MPSFSIPAVRSKAFLGQGYTVPPAPWCLTRYVFLPNNLSYQDVPQQPFLLTVAYAQGLQYWARDLTHQHIQMSAPWQGMSWT